MQEIDHKNEGIRLDSKDCRIYVEQSRTGWKATYLGRGSPGLKLPDIRGSFDFRHKQGAPRFDDCRWPLQGQGMVPETPSLLVAHQALRLRIRVHQLTSAKAHRHMSQCCRVHSKSYVMNAPVPLAR